MSKDIRSFFTVLSKKPSAASSSNTNQVKRPSVLLDSDDDDVIKGTPEKAAKVRKAKRKVKVLSSDSEDDGRSKKNASLKKQKVTDTKQENTTKPQLKPISIDSLNQPIKQTEVKCNLTEDIEIGKKPQHASQPKKEKRKKPKHVELGIHEDKDFEKTLEMLDEDADDTILLDNLDLLDKTIEEATLPKSGNTVTSPSTKNQSSAVTPKQVCAKDSEPAKSEKDARNLKTNIVHVIDDTPKKAGKRQRKTSETNSTPKKRAKLEHIDSGIDPDIAKTERKRQSAGLYVAYLHRPGPKNHGTKEYPKGTPNCLAGCIFLRTGVLDSLEGEEFENLVTDHGGKVVHSVSKKISYVVVGDEPGPSKLEKARKYGLPEISEDDFLDLILRKSGMKAKYTVKRECDDFGESGEQTTEINEAVPTSDKNSTLESGNQPLKNNVEEINCKPKVQSHKVNNSDKPSADGNQDLSNGDKSENLVPKNKVVLDLQQKETAVQTQESVKSRSMPQNISSECMAWTDKYKPTNVNGIIGQKDSNSNMNKLKKWLQNWFKNADPEIRKKLPRPTLYHQYDGAYFKAALLSGPPGVGKTTTATLVAKELGFDIVEFNASDTRSKKLLHEEISHMMKSKTVAGFVSGRNNINQKRVLLMDEVDGMAGNEDRGGIAELINFIKTASFPIICMCNNRDLPKMRSLVNHCFALKYTKPNVMQVKGAMMSICFKEGLSIESEALSRLITGTGCDIRQTINHLAMWSATEKALTTEKVTKDSKNSQKDVVFGAWDVIRKVFNKSENENMSLLDKSRLFFYDYSFGPMFVQENYLTVQPECTGSKGKKIETLIRRHLTADCLSRSDLIESKIRSTNNWSLLESQAFLCTVMPSYYLSGKMEQVRFPSWFGKNSQRNKSLRIAGEFYSHARTSISADKTSLRLDYAEPLMKRLMRPLMQKQAAGIDDTLDVMKSYSLLREDLTNLCELTANFTPNKRNPFDCVNSSVKSALTRKYNKTVTLSFAPPSAAKKKKGAKADEDVFEEEAFSDEEATDDEVGSDALIKVKESKKAKGKNVKGDKKTGKGKNK
ncbi:replication factor C subunit 1 [Dendroctonus ponderosae]|uniref:replication factor C subunit 1 n=1 Tax=Dendroctonus ponderosae TaxID=77166 RepID=UPI00203560D6|nr:replication factor C subunit 1 [Dendroctonus ponderosae]KAH1024059.1 hypothetical protein HUJ05_003619 [Dendroctonus ponderosae]